MKYVKFWILVEKFSSWKIFLLDAIYFKHSKKFLKNFHFEISIWKLFRFTKQERLRVGREETGGASSMDANEKGGKLD